MDAKELLKLHAGDFVRHATEADANNVRQFCRWDGNCFVWTRGISIDTGYGSMRCMDGRTRRVHRIIWESVHGLPPHDHFVVHTCLNPACCRIEHLKLETAKERAHRAVKSRAARAEAVAIATKAPRHKKNQRLSMEVIMGLFDDVTFNGLSVRKAAKKYDCSPSTVMAIKNGEAWNHLTNHHYDPNLNDVSYSRGKVPIHRVMDIVRDTRVYREIADDFNISTGAVHKIKHGYLYADITGIAPGGKYDPVRID